MTETVPARSVTGRGFTIYDELADSKASRIRVQDSSAAFGPYVWIFADHAEPGMYLTHADRMALAGFDLAELAAKLSPSPHLDVTQAERVRDALDAFIREAKGAE